MAKTTLIHPLLISKGVKPRKGQVRNCGFCSKDIYVGPCHLIRKVSFCSKEHQIAFQKQNAFNFPCKNCGEKVFTQPAQLKLRARSYCGSECRRTDTRKMAVERRKNEGYTKHQLDRLARYSIEASEWRKAVFERDDYTCQLCNTRGNYLEADHIKPWAYFPNLRFDINNGRTLCRPCHDKTKISAKRMKEIYG